MNTEDPSPVGNGGKQSVSITPTKAPPTRLPKEDFPHQPPGSSPTLPFTMENLQHMLDAYEIDLRWDVIKKRESYSRNGHPTAHSDIISLANLNGIYNGRIDDFLTQIAMRNSTNPAADWIDSVPWDGKDRLQTLYDTVHVLEGYPESLANTLLYRWLLSIAAAALSKENFHSRGVLTLQGAQGIGKTSWIASLVPSDLVKLDHHLDAHNKDSILLATSHLVVEIGELDSSFRKDVARLKGFLTSPVDKIRPPYGRRSIEMPRRTVFAGSVNESNFLVDETGNSRWWTIPCEKLDFKHGIDMQQLFAQLAIDFRRGEQWWLTAAEEAQLEEQNSHFLYVGVIEEQILERVLTEGTGGKYMTARQLLLELGFANPTNPQCKEAGKVLRRLFGQPKRVQGRDQWKVSLRSNEQVWQKHAEDADDY